jgi:hypothetical protein
MAEDRCSLAVASRIEHLADVLEQDDAGVLALEASGWREGCPRGSCAPFPAAGVGDRDERPPNVRCAVVQLGRQLGVAVITTPCDRMRRAS